MKSFLEKMSGVNLMTGKKIEDSNLELIEMIERDSTIKEAEEFFQLERDLLQRIFELERDSARRTLREIKNLLNTKNDIVNFKMIKYYYIVLSSVLVRQMKDAGLLDEQRAFQFIATCMEIIEEKLTPSNIGPIGDELIEFYCYILTDKEKPALAHETVNEVIQYIDENVEKQLVVEEIAKKFNVSTSHLSRIFREYTSVTLVEFITIRKIEEVQYYLRFTDQKISEISDRFHFCNQSYFTRVFKKYTGWTPRKFRNEMNGEYFQFVMKKDDSL